MITADHDQLIALNVEPIVAKIKGTLLLWKSRDPSLFGHIQ